MYKKLLIVFLLAFLVRLIAIDQSLWLDEAVTANVVESYSYSEIITKFSPTDFHPPLFYLVEKFWINIFGYSEIALRFPSVIFSLITGWMIYLIGKKMKDANVGLFAAALFLFNPLIIYYSQEARMYSLITLFVTMIIYYLLKIAGPGKSFPPVSARHGSHDLRAVRSPSTLATRNIVLINIFILLSFLTFYGSIFFIFAIYIWLLIKREFKLLFMLLPGFILAVLLVFPLFINQYLNSKIALNDVKNWSLVLGKANIKNLLLIPLKFSIGRISFEPKILYYSIAGLWSLFVFYFLAKGWKNTLFLITLLTVFLAFIASFFTPLLQYFRFIYLIPLISLLLAINTKNKLTKAVLLSGFIIFSLIYLLNSNYHREDWKSLVGDLKTKTIYMIPSSSDAVKYYNKNIEVRSLNQVSEMHLENEITVIPYTSEIHGVDYVKELSRKYYELSSEKSYRELKIETWKL
ncbi:MAG: glycosyltransferase family 39 protein [Nanoarchaeota archaeon]